MRSGFFLICAADSYLFLCLFSFFFSSSRIGMISRRGWEEREKEGWECELDFLSAAAGCLFLFQSFLHLPKSSILLKYWVSGCFMVFKSLWKRKREEKKREQRAFLLVVWTWNLREEAGEREGKKRKILGGFLSGFTGRWAKTIFCKSAKMKSART